MTVGSIPTLLALSSVAAAQPGAVPVVPSPGAGAAGLAQPGIATPAAQETALPAALAPQIAAGSALDALVLKAAAQAALGEGGLAMLMADLSQAQRAAGLPTSVQAAITQVLALRAPINAPPTSADLRAALTPSSQSSSSLPSVSPASPEAALAAALGSGGPLKNALVGLQQVLTTWLANTPASPAPAATPALPTTSGANVPETPPPQPGVTPVLANLAQALRVSGLPAPIQAALLQSLAPLAAPTVPSPAAPPSQPGAAPALAQSAPAPAVVPAPALSTAPAESAALSASLDPAPPAALDLIAPSSPSGASAELPLAPAAGPTAPNSSTVSPADIKAALASLQTMASATAPTAAETAAPATVATIANALAASVLAALPANVDPKEAMLVFQQVFKAWLDEGSMPASAPPSAAGAVAVAAPITGSSRAAPLPALPASTAPTATNSPPPPYRGGPTTAQPAVPSTLPTNADPVTLGARLLRETSAALAHQELLQIASLPASTQGPAPGAGQSQQWMFEIPFATAQGTAIAQFKITRDGGKGRNKGEQAPVWRARFSLDVEPMGPVHAQIVLSGDRTWVSLWAEREESVARLRQHEGLLTSSLKDANFTPEVAFHAGAPRQPATNGGQFLNRAS